MRADPAGRVVVNSSRPSPEPGGEGLLAGPSGQRGATTGAEDADTRKLLRNRARTTTAQRLTPLARRPTTPASHGSGDEPAGRARRLPDLLLDAASRRLDDPPDAEHGPDSRTDHGHQGLRRAHLAHERPPRPASPSPPQRHHLPPAAPSGSPPSRPSGAGGARTGPTARTRPRSGPARCAPGPLRQPPGGGPSAPTPSPGTTTGSRAGPRRSRAWAIIFETTGAVDPPPADAREHPLVRLRRRAQLLRGPQHLDGPLAQRNPVLALRLHPLLGARGENPALPRARRAPADRRGARLTRRGEGESLGTFRPRSNAVRRDASPLECSGDFRHGPLGGSSTPSRRCRSLATSPT